MVIEDACQAHGAEYKGRRVGSLGDMGCFSFYPGKNLGAYGEGGMVTTSNAEYTRTIRMLRDWGAERKYQHLLKGYNYRLEGMQGAVLRVKLRHLEAWTEARRAVAARYGDLLAGSGVPTPRRCPTRDMCATFTRCALHSGRRGRKRCRLRASILEFTIRHLSTCSPHTPILVTGPGSFPIRSERRARCYRSRYFPN